MCSFEKKNASGLPSWFEASLLQTRQYLDDIFKLFSSFDHAEKFKDYLSSKHPNIDFLLEKENYGGLSFLYSIFCEKGKFVINVYWKKTFSSVYTNFNRFIPETCKTDLTESLLF